MEPLVLRPSSVIEYETCGHLYWLRSVLRIQTETVSHALAFGTAGHKAVLGYVRAEAEGGSLDPVQTFQAAWKEQLDTKVIHFGRHSVDDLTEIGSKLAAAWPEAWAKTGYKVALGNGVPLVENRLKAQISSGLVLSGEPDLVVELPDGALGVPDVKFPGAESGENFVAASDQLTAYSVLAEANRARLGLDARPIVQVGFIEGLKQKTNPKWSVARAPARGRQQMLEYVQKLQMTATLIRKGYFPKRSAMAFNSPCTDCEMAGLCLRRDPKGLESRFGDVMDLAYGKDQRHVAVAS
jgi:hypothetical protein